MFEQICLMISSKPEFEIVVLLLVGITMIVLFTGKYKARP